MKNVRIGIIGFGKIGLKHADYLLKGEVKGAQLSAVCVSSLERLTSAREALGEAGAHVPVFCEPEAFFRSGIDGVIIATPHFSHSELTVEAFRNGLHVLCEKPAAVHVKQVKLMNEAASRAKTVYAMMFNRHTNPVNQAFRRIILSGELGRIKRTQFTSTEWYRTQSYYDSSDWFGTWEGEGGGLLLTQASHHLDLWQWIIGIMPVRVRAYCSFGKERDIEVENDVTAYLEYGNGVTGVFIASAIEAPGTNRLEVVGDRGKLVLEEDRLTFWRLKVPEPEFNRTYRGGYLGKPEYERIEVPKEGRETGHQGITQNWVEAIREGAPLLAPGEDGINGVIMANAMLLSTWTNDWVGLPLDDDLYVRLLEKQINQSVFVKR